ncbi:DEHA2F23826p [Debaryomyces hansenii CBS767]|jgi:2,3-diketo-5-methylthio-1-phosphopentane phosphatase|uniref:DEHA2F23826p n=1 Tax=Debaryomyces hansenii (strain ATCC 36239 / CBS 767 / BCRC 21394 / JCM 1990 / NBRC 0083 / IGC 2968) TaxID=284592 RepID=Q6BK93_DEBHA|nr:DEHA2F23826p [Debaryomyces hansenii CBS767]CAG89785.1 DEHA2F23826p [Debaryomyces hansenii CBS767]|eukprot:XP_461378.1 DEHA2F23826p [Debaryomyces hansenii CBS767]
MSGPPAIVFTDWDGTVTLQDSNDYLTENLGFGKPRRLEINDEILNERLSFQEGFSEMLKSIPTPFPKCIEYLLEHIQLDPGFKGFYQWCFERNIPVIVISSGMKPIIHALLKNLVGDEAIKNIEIISNEVNVNEDGTWNIVYKDPESSFGHDKSKSIREYLQRNGYSSQNMPLLFYCGDGVSDLSAAKETDLLFAKHGKDLITYCNRENIPYTEFNSFEDIFSKITKIVEANGKNINDFLENH